EEWMRQQEEQRKKAEAKFKQDQERMQNEFEEQQRQKQQQQQRQQQQQKQSSQSSAPPPSAGPASSSVPTAQSMTALWESYEKRWQELAKSPPASLTLYSIPFPVAQARPTAAQINPQTVAQFILSTQHSPHKSRKARLKDAMLRWHPDKFEQKWLNKVPEPQRAMAKECASAVAKSVTALMEREKEGPRSA
ncbi:hypothetical protein CALVIDRAFT_481585, partial [Calocera viscosa TUFC12733]